MQIVGASAPSLRIDNAESGPTKRVGLGISTAINNFIQGAQMEIFVFLTDTQQQAQFYLVFMTLQTYRKLQE